MAKYGPYDELEPYYDHFDQVPYPKVGANLSKVTLHVWEKESQTVRELRPPDEVSRLG